MESEEKTSYEIGFLAKDESGVPEVLKLLNQHGATIDFEGPLKKIILAYKIRRESQAYFGYFHFKMLSSEVGTFDKDLKNKQVILRFLVVTPPFLKAVPFPPVRKREIAPSPQMQPISKPPPTLSNEELERKIDEILQ